MKSKRFTYIYISPIIINRKFEKFHDEKKGLNLNWMSEMVRGRMGGEEKPKPKRRMVVDIIFRWV